MKLTFIWSAVLSLIIFSCQNKQTGLEEISRQNIDTVMIDTGAELLYLGEEYEFLGLSGLSSDGSKLFIFDPEGVRLSIVDMKSQNLERTIDLEKEGPNGLGDWFIGFQVESDTSFIALGNNRLVIFDINGIIKKEIEMDHLFYLNEDLLKKYITVGFLLKDDRVFNMISEISEVESDILIYDNIEDTYEYITNPLADLVKNSSVKSWIGKSSFLFTSGYSLQEYSSGFIVSNRGFSKMMNYSFEGDLIRTSDVKSKFYEDEVTVEKIRQVQGDEGYNEFKKEQEKLMKFLRPVWDKTSNQLYRLGYKLSSDGVNYDNYLFVFDSELNLIKERQLIEVTAKPIRLYKIGSKGYIAANFSDELGFVVFDL
jgi:hypothetical protein